MAGFAAARWYLDPRKSPDVAPSSPCFGSPAVLQAVPILPSSSLHSPAEPTHCDCSSAAPCTTNRPSSPWVSLRHRFRGRDAGCPAPPAQIRTCALTHTAPTFGSDRDPRGDARIRSTACVTVPRLSVRPVLWPRGFPSVTGLGSSNSAAAHYRLVGCVHRYYAGVRLLRALHHRLTASRLPDAVPPVAR